MGGEVTGVLGLLLVLSVILNGYLVTRVRELERGRPAQGSEALQAQMNALAASVRAIAQAPAVVRTPVLPVGKLVLRDAHDRETVAVVPMPEIRPRKLQHAGVSYEQTGWHGSDMWYRAEGLNGG